MVKIRAGVTSAGKIVFWDYQVIGAGDREARTFYDVPHQRTTSAGGWQRRQSSGHAPVRSRAVARASVNTNTFARESHMDLLAAKAAMDPLEFRLNHLTDARMRRVLEAAAKQFGWKPARSAQRTRRGRGLRHLRRHLRGDVRRSGGRHGHRRTCG